MQNKHIIDKYRQEIDGFRSIAIISVLLFHFFPKTFPNGYLGVDMFFVISGFLIASGLDLGMREGRFSFASFYLKRIKRILPGVLVLLLVCTLISFIFLLSPDLIKYAKSLLASLGFYSNIHFFLTGGYFGGNDELKPLLHMWSLSVEEQFYILFPIFLYAIIRFVKSIRFRLLIVLMVCIFSFLINIYLNKIGGANASFFLMPTRVWQFGVGVLFALLPKKEIANNYFKVSIILFGLSLITWNFYDPTVRLPAASLMTIGTGLLLWSQWQENGVLKKCFSFSPIRWIGVISFSLYLWHWPIVSYLRYISIDEISSTISILGLIASIFLGYLSWRYIEEPFRKNMSSKHVILFVCFLYVLLGSLGFCILKENGFPNRHSYEADKIASAIDSNFRCPKSGSFPFGGARACGANLKTDNKYTYALLGNSHALMYAPIFTQILKSVDESGIIVPLNGCIPTYTINISKECMVLAKKNYESVLVDKNIKTVVIGTTWEHLKFINLNGREIPATSEVLQQALWQLIVDFKKEGKIVYLIGPIETPQVNFPSILSRSIAFNRNENIVLNVSKNDFDKKFNLPINFFRSKMGSAFIQPSRFLCDENSCYFAKHDAAYYADQTHLSADGIKVVEGAFEQFSNDVKVRKLSYEH